MLKRIVIMLMFTVLTVSALMFTSGIAAYANTSFVQKADLAEELYDALLDIYNSGTDAGLLDGDALPADAFSARKTLFLNNRNIAELDGMDLFDFSALEQLSFSGNNLVSIAGLPVIPSLKHLNLSNNFLVTLEGFPIYTSLMECNLSGNSLTSLAWMPSMASLTVLDVSENQIDDFTALPYLPALIEFDASNNALSDSAYMPSPSNIPALNYIDLSVNSLTDFASMPSYTSVPLKICDVSGNALSTYNNIQKFKNAAVGELKLSVTGNPVMEEDNSAALSALAALGIYVLYQNEEGETIQLNEEEPEEPNPEPPVIIAAENGLPAYAIALICVGCALAAGGAGTAVFFIIKKKKGKHLIVFVLIALAFSLFSANMAVFALESEDPYASEIYSITDSSVVANGRVTLYFYLDGYVDSSNAEACGMVYSSIDAMPERGGQNVVEVSGDILDFRFVASSLELEHDTVYYARTFSVHAGYGALYSEVFTYRTPNVLDEGECVGNENAICGSKHYVKSNYANVQSRYGVIIENGYNAWYNGKPYFSLAPMTRKGMNILVTEEISTGEKYLHYFELVLGDEPVTVTEFSADCQKDGENTNYAATLQYTIGANFGQTVQEYGILYGGSYKLAIGYGDTEKLESHSLNGNVFSQEYRELYNGSERYFRGYAKAGGKYYYSATVKHLKIEDNIAQFMANITVNDDGTRRTYYDFYVYSTTEDEINGTKYTEPGQKYITDEGQYFRTTKWDYGEGDIHFTVTYFEIDHTPTDVNGIEHYLKYRKVYDPVAGSETTEYLHIADLYNNRPVVAFTDEYNVEMYLTADGSPVPFGNGVMIHENGYYQLTVVSDSSIDIYEFSIADPVVTTGDSLQTQARSTEVSGEFVPNGSFLEKGFVYSSAAPAPLVGAETCLTFVPEDGQSLQTLSATLNGLLPETTYYYRAYLKYGNTQDPMFAYGEPETFTTSALSVPVVATGYPSGITNNSIVLNSFLVYDGGSDITERGIVYSQSANPECGIDGSATVSVLVTSNQSFSVLIQNLLPSTGYHFRAYAVNATGTGYGEDVYHNTYVQYTVIFDLDGGTRTGGGELEQYGGYGFSAEEPVAEKTGFEFCGWDTDFDNITGNITVTAVWMSGKYTRVVFKPNGGTRTGGGELSQIITKGFAADAPVLEYTGYDFNGWDKSFDNVQSYTVVTALWSMKRINVYFSLAGGTRTGGGTLAQIVNYGAAAIAPQAEYDGHTFLGWDKSFDNITETVTITALWSIETYTVTFDCPGWTAVSGEKVQRIEYGSAAIAPVIQRDGYDFLCWDKAFDNITADMRIYPVWARLIRSTAEWTESLDFSAEVSHESAVLSVNFVNDYYVIYHQNDIYTIEENMTIRARCEYGGNQYDVTSLVIDNIDSEAPSLPSYDFIRVAGNQIELFLQGGNDAGSGVVKDQYRIGKSGLWIDFQRTAVIRVPVASYISLRSYDALNHVSETLTEYLRVSLVDLDGGDTVRNVIYKETGDRKQIMLSGGYNEDNGMYNPYVHFSYGDNYIGCGVKAGQIFMNWFGVDLPQSFVNDYVETTDFGKYLTWMDNLYDPGIFTTPAQLNSGIQDMLDQYLPDENYDVVRHSPETSASAIAMIESYLAHGYPVAVLVNDGAHWQIVVESDVTRQSGGIQSAQFLVLDNAGMKWRDWSDMDYFFEDNFSAELAREFDYTSYVDTIMSIQRREPVQTDNWSSGWTSSEFYTVNGNDYLFLLKKGNGLVHINHMNDDGTTGTIAHVFDWSQGWSNVSFFYENENTYMVLFKSSNQLVHIRRMNADGSYGELVYQGNVDAGVVRGKIKSFRTANIGTKNIVYAYTDQCYHLTMELSSEGLGDYTGSLHTASDIISSSVYTSGGNTYLIAKDENDFARVYSISQETGAIGDSTEFAMWSEGWTNLVTYEIEGNAYLFVMKSGNLNLFGFDADPEGITNMRALDEDGNIAELVDSAYFEPYNGAMLCFGYTNIRFYQNKQGQTMMFMLRGQDGKVQIYRINRDGAIKTNIS